MNKKSRINTVTIILLIFVALPTICILTKADWLLLLPHSTPTLTETPSVDKNPTLASFETLALPETPTITATAILSFPCKLPQDNLEHDYVVPRYLLLESIYRQIFGSEPDSYDLYAITYYNNRKILEGYTIYHIIDPVILSVGRGWKIFIPPQNWIEKYKAFPVSIPQFVQTNSRSTINISGSSILSPLSSQISKCFAEATEIQSTYTNLGNTESGLRDYCQGKVDLFGANKEISPEMLIQNGCTDVELKKFEVARYAMVIFINENNPNVSDLRKNPLTNEELGKLIASSFSWNDIRGYWHAGPVKRYYPPLESSKFEVIQDNFFSNSLAFNPPEWNEFDDEKTIADKVLGDPLSIGIASYNFYKNYKNKDELVVIPVENVSPNSETLNGESQKYPLASTLYLYTGKTTYENSPVLQNFINYYLSYELDFIDNLGYLYPSRNGYLRSLDAPPQP